MWITGKLLEIAKNGALIPDIGKQLVSTALHTTHPDFARDGVATCLLGISSETQNVSVDNKALRYFASASMGGRHAATGCYPFYL